MYRLAKYTHPITYASENYWFDKTLAEIRSLAARDTLCTSIYSVLNKSRIDISIVKDNERRVAAKLHRGPLDGRGALFDQQLPESWGCSTGFLKYLDMVLGNFGLDRSKIRIGFDVIESQILLAIQANGYTIADGQGVMQYARSIKNEDEIALLKHGAAIVDAAFHRIACEIRPGAKENDLQAVASHEMHRLGAQWIHNVQVTSGNRTNPHPHLSSDRLLQPGDIIFMDIVCLYNCYHTCVYRCFTVGPPSQKQIDTHARCLETQLGGVDAVKPGCTTADVVTRWPDYRQMGALNEHEIFGLQYGHGIGDGGFIAQFFDARTDELLGVSSDTWRCIAIHRAPLNKSCERSADPESECEAEIQDPPRDWVRADFVDSDWPMATVHTASAVRPHGGFDSITWDPAAQLIWSGDLETDNTNLCRVRITTGD